jgi:Zn-dependent M28 family amino/carboxypeptidase
VVEAGLTGRSPPSLKPTSLCESLLIHGDRTRSLSDSSLQPSPRTPLQWSLVPTRILPISSHSSPLRKLAPSVTVKLTTSGADDDGSGTTSSLEGLKALAHANFTPSLPVEFHYFSAEEGGLLGSQAIAKSYEEEGRKVLAMLQMDMTAWVKKGTEERVGIIQDFVDPTLTSFIEELIAEYREFEPSTWTHC